ncbi:MAG: LptF/LptG family permease [Candidatus Margulisiibacteriota bacterium]
MWRFSTINRYLIKEFYGPFFFSLGGFVIIGLVDFIFALVDLFINSGVPFGTVFRLLVYKIPAIMVMFLPMSAIFATMLLMVRMAKDNEIAVLRTSGVSIFRVIIPIALLGLGTALFSWGINEFVTPWANQVSDRLIQHSIRKQPPPKVVDNVFFKEMGNRFLFIENVNIETGEMRNLLLFEKASTPYPRLITSKQAQWDEKSWYLKDGFIHEINRAGDLKYISHFETTIIHIERDLGSFYTKHKTPRQMDSNELKEKITTLDRGGINTSALEVEYHLKKSLPAACFIFCLMGLTFCVTFVRTGKDWWGVIWAIVIVVLLVGFYFFLMATFRALGKRGIMSPFLSAWIPNLIYFFPCTGVLLYDGIKR